VIIPRKMGLSQLAAGKNSCQLSRWRRHFNARGIVATNRSKFPHLWLAEAHLLHAQVGVTCVTEARTLRDAGRQLLGQLRRRRCALRSVLRRQLQVDRGDSDVIPTAASYAVCFLQAVASTDVSLDSFRARE
jgi:hypothetical protein